MTDQELCASWRLSRRWPPTWFSLDFTGSPFTPHLFLKPTSDQPLECEAQKGHRRTLQSHWTVGSTSVLQETAFLMQAKFALIFLAVRSHYWPALRSLTILAPQAFHINCNYTRLPLPTPVPFGPRGRTLHLFQLNFILLNPVHHSILSKMPGALIRFSKIYAILPQVSTHQSTHIWTLFFVCVSSVLCFEDLKTFEPVAALREPADL